MILLIFQLFASPIILKKAKCTFFDGKEVHGLANFKSIVGFYKENLKDELEELKKDRMKSWCEH